MIWLREEGSWMIGREAETQAVYIYTIDAKLM